MARKMVLVPNELYQSMLSASDALSDTARVMAAKSDVHKVFRSRARAGPKRLLLDKRTRDFLKLRREAVEKAVRVQVTNVDDIKQPPITTVITPSAQAPTPPPQTKKKQKKAKTIGLQTNIPPPSEEQASTSFSAPPSPTSTPRRPPPATQRQKEREASRAIGEEANNNRINALVEMIQRDRAKFGLSKDNKILGNTGLPLADVKDAIKHILDPSAGQAATPRGTALLQGRILRDPDAKTALNRAQVLMNRQFGKGAKAKRTTSFRPQLWKSF